MIIPTCAPVLAIPTCMDEGPALQRMIDLVTDLARWQNCYPVAVLEDILQMGNTSSRAIATKTTSTPA